MTVRVVLLIVLLVAPAAGQTSPPVSDIAARAWVDRTAMWVGDQVTYTVEVASKRSIELLTDDLSRDKLKLDGLEVIGGEAERHSGPQDQNIHVFRYVLTTYRVDASTLSVAPFTARYGIRRSGQRIEEAPAVGEVQIPGVTIAFRSALQEGDAMPEIRASRSAHARPRRFALLPSLGIALIIVSLAPALFALGAIARQTRQPRRRSTRVVRHAERESLEMVRGGAIETAEGRREAFNQLQAIVREHLRDVCGVPGPSLTPQEAEAAVVRVRAHAPAELVRSVLAVCETARYAPPHALPPAEACRQAIEHVEQIIARP